MVRTIHKRTTPLGEAFDIVTAGTDQFLEGQEHVAQDILTRLTLILGEWFRNLNDGTNWFGAVFGKQTTNPEAEGEIKRRILETESVDLITKYEAKYDMKTRKYSAIVEVLTVFSAMPLELNINQPVSITAFIGGDNG